MRVAIVGIECLSIDAVHHGAVQIDGWRHVAAVRGVGRHAAARCEQASRCADDG